MENEKREMWSIKYEIMLKTDEANKKVQHEFVKRSRTILSIAHRKDDDIMEADSESIDFDQNPRAFGLQSHHYTVSDVTEIAIYRADKLQEAEFLF